MPNTRPEFWQRITTEESAKVAARGWLANPTNKMSLPENNKGADADGDGLVSSKEFAQMFDLDGDGNLSQHELAKAAKLFAMVDKDGDGQLTEEELKQVWHSGPPARRKPDAPIALRPFQHGLCSNRLVPRSSRTRARRRSRRETAEAKRLTWALSYSTHILSFLLTLCP
jgi:hypothetical protein